MCRLLQQQQYLFSSKPLVAPRCDWAINARYLIDACHCRAGVRSAGNQNFKVLSVCTTTAQKLIIISNTVFQYGFENEALLFCHGDVIVAVTPP